MTNFRSDGFNNPLSINSGIGCSWDDVETACDESEAVKSYVTDRDSITINWCDGSTDTYQDTQAALIAIEEME